MNSIKDFTATLTDREVLENPKLVQVVCPAISAQVRMSSAGTYMLGPSKGLVA